MDVWFATTNSGKHKEVKRLLNNYEVYSLIDLKTYAPPAETGDSFLANARIKAKSLRSLKKDCWILADDSGIEIEGLGNLPGIHSARYAGAKASDIENSTKAIKMLALRSPENRKARFVCHLVALSPTDEEFIFEAELKGEISKTMRGTDGFGYDNIFIPEGNEKTLAELGVAFKNMVSHRAKALKNFKAHLES